MRWGLVSNILRALTALGRWRLDGEVGPMHKWYDPKLFDIMSHDDVLSKYAARDRVTGVPMDVARTADDLARARRRRRPRLRPGVRP